MSDFTPRSGMPQGDKLLSSAVHPAVARARGYAVALPGDERDALASTGFQPPNQNWDGYRKVRKCSATGSVLLMPWYRPGVDDPAVIQFRPEKPLVGKDGKLQKYLQAAGAPPILDVHPAIPREWYSDTNVPVLLMEGLLKGDSVVSAMVGGLPEDATREDVTAALRAVPAFRRVLPLSMFGVTTWHNNPEWNSLPRAERHVYVSFDADVNENPHVAKEARGLFKYVSSSHGVPHLVDLTQDGGDGKEGIDDLMARKMDGRSWADSAADRLNLLDDIQDHAGSEVPDLVGVAREPGRAYVEGEHGERVVTYTRSNDDSDPTPVAHPLVEVGGYVEAIELKRAPTEREILKGVISGSDAERGATTERWVRLRVAFTDADNEVKEDIILGPEKILQVAPDRWDRIQGVEVPTDVSMLPGWPPKMEWLDAVKRNTAENYSKPQMEVRCTVNGWVPGTSGIPVYVLGTTQIGVNDSIVLSRDRLTVPMIDRFGLVEPEGTWQDAIRDLLPQVVDTMLGQGAWTNPGVGVITMSAGLRPLIPVRPKTTLYYLGPRGSGKSWTGSKCSGFWGAFPGAFGSRNAGGSASDTYAAMEHATATMPGWVADDLAPSASMGAANSRESNISDVIRGIANGQGKSRMRPDGTARPTAIPRAMLVVTAENSLNVSSARDRVIPIFLPQGSLGNTDGVNEMFDNTSVPSMLSSCVVHYMLDMAQAQGWDAVVDLVKRAQDEVNKRTTAKLEVVGIDSGSSTRFREMSADILSPFMLLRFIGASMGMRNNPLLEPLYLDPLFDKALDIIVEAVQDRTEHAPGYQFLQALTSLMGSGQGHVEQMSGDMPVTTSSPDSLVINAALGWKQDGNGGMRAGGPAIGAYDPERKAVILVPGTAFNLAQRHYPNLVPPGTNSDEAFKAMASEDLIGNSKGVGTSKVHSIALGNGRRTTKRGVLIPLSSIILPADDEASTATNHQSTENQEVAR